MLMLNSWYGYIFEEHKFLQWYRKGTLSSWKFYPGVNRVWLPFYGRLMLKLRFHQLRWFASNNTMFAKEEGNLTWKKNISEKGEFIRRPPSFRNRVTGSSDACMGLSTFPDTRWGNTTEKHFLFCMVFTRMAATGIPLKGVINERGEMVRKASVFRNHVTGLSASCDLLLTDVG